MIGYENESPPISDIRWVLDGLGGVKHHKHRASGICHGNPGTSLAAR